MPAAGRNEGPPAGSPGPGTSRPRLGIVVAGQGSVTPVEAYSALREDYRPVFLVEPGTESAKLTAALDALARRAEVHRLPAAGAAVPAAGAAVPAEVGELQGVTTFCADGVPVALELAGRLGLPALADGGGRSLYDKVAQRAALGPGLSPRFVALPPPGRAIGPGPDGAGDRQEWIRAATALGLPAVLKPAYGQASRGVRRIVDVPGLLAAHDAIASAGFDPATPDTPWLLEELLAGQDRWPRAGYVSVESVVSGSRVRHLALTRKLPMAEPFREVGQYLLPPDQQPADSAALLDATTDALARLRVAHAVTHTELILTAAGPKVVEVNARVGGLVRDLVRAGRGVDLARAAAAAAVGDPPDCPDEAGRSPGLVFQYAPLAPIEPAEFRQAHGIDAVGSLAGVDKYLPHVAAGELLPGGTETVTMGVFSGTCRDEEELAAVLTELEGLLSYEFLLCPEGEPVRCDARGRML